MKETDQPEGQVAETDVDLQDAVDFYLQKLRAGDWDSAFHGITELEPAIVPLLITAYQTERSPDVRSGLLQIIWEFRMPLALPLLDEALRDRSANRWKGALNGLVTLASQEAVEALERVLKEEAAVAKPDGDYLEWVGEALEQCREAYRAKATP